MSVKATFWAFEQRHLKPTDKLVLLVLANFANDLHECWPSYQRIARDSVICRRTAIDTIKRLELLGLVKIQQRRNQEGRQSSNIFKLQVKATAKQSAKQSAESAPITASEPQNSEAASNTQNRVQNLHPSVQMPRVQSAKHDTALVQNLHSPVLQIAPEPITESKNTDAVVQSDTEIGERKFRMPNNWQPSREFKTRAEKHGVKTIDELDLDEFRMHWSEELRQLTQSQWENKFLENLLHRQGRKIKKIKPQSPMENPVAANEAMGKLEALRRLRSLGKLSDYSKIDAQIAAAENELNQLKRTM